MKRLSSLALALLITGAMACGGSSKSDQMARDALVTKDSPYAFHRSIANTLLRTKQPAKALGHIRKLMRIQPDNSAWASTRLRSPPSATS